MKKDDLELFLYRHKLQDRTLTELLQKLSFTTKRNIFNNLSEYYDGCGDKRGDKRGDKQGDNETNKTEQNCEDTVYIFTDGNCIKNGRSGATAGYGVWVTDDETDKLHGLNKFGKITHDATNNKAELTAILVALENFLKFVETGNMDEKIKYLVICTDSMYSINCLSKWYKNWETNDWKTSNKKPVKNANLIKDILKNKNYILSYNINISFKHIMSHMEKPEEKNSKAYMLWYGNDRVDTLINEKFFKRLINRN